MFYGAGQTTRLRFPAGISLDELARSQQTDQIARQFLGALGLNAQAGSRRSPARNRAEQGAQRIRLSAGDMRQLVSEHAHHRFIRAQTSEKNGSKLDPARIAAEDSSVV